MIFAKCRCFAILRGDNPLLGSCEKGQILPSPSVEILVKGLLFSDKKRQRRFLF